MVDDGGLFTRLSGDERFVALTADARPASAWTADGRTIVWANAAGARLLGLDVTDIAAGAGTLGVGPLAGQLTQIARRLGETTAIRLERIRFPGLGQLDAIACACRRLALSDDAAVILVTALEMPRWLRVRPVRIAPPADPLVVEALGQRPAGATDVTEADGSWRWSSSEGTKQAVDTPQEPPTPARRTRPIRFVFQTDEAGRFAEISPTLAEAIGATAGEWIGRRLDEVGEATPEARAALADAIARAETFTRHCLDWTDSAARLVTAIELSAVPAHGPDNAFIGYRGFGICRPPVDMPDEEVAAVEPDEAVVAVEPDEVVAAAEPDEVVAAAEPETVPATEIESPVVTIDEAGPHEVAQAAPAEESVAAPQAEAQTPQPVVEPTQEPPPEAVPAHKPVATPAAKIVALRGETEGAERPSLTASERNAFRELARALGARMEGEEQVTAAEWPAGTTPTSDRTVDPVQRLREEFRRTGGPEPEAERSEPPTRPASAPTALLDRLPLALMIARGEQALFVNRALLDLVGHADVAAFEAAGGLAGLFVGKNVTGLAGDSAVEIRRADGTTLAVEGRIQTTPWNEETAVLVSLRRPAEAATPADSDRDARAIAEAQAALEAEREAAAAATRRADELQAVLDTATDGVVIVDGEGIVIGLNRSAEALFGYEASEIAGESMLLLFAGDSHRSASDYLEGLRLNGVASVLNDGREITGRVRQGGRVPLFMTMGRLGDGDRFCAVLRDITQFKRAEQDLMAAKRQAEEASSHKSDFLAKVSHEIRTPLNAIIGFAEVMMEERFGPIENERYRTYLRDIHGAGEHVMGLVNDLLDLAKIEAGRLDLSFSAVALNDIVEQCVAIMQPQANRERIIIRTSLSRTLPNIVADGRTLRQVVLNLLSNSIKFTPKGGQVIVSTTLSENGEAVLRVRDTGVGMSETELAIAMEPFRQVQTNQQRGGGTGLGLPLTKALVEANRASFIIQSAKNSGTLVEVVFPPTRVLAE